MGSWGQPAPVGETTGPRATDLGNNPYLLLRVADNIHYVPAVLAEPGSRPTPTPAEHGAADRREPQRPSPWTEELDPETRRLVKQEAESAPLPPGHGQPAAIGRVAEMHHLARQAGDETSAREAARASVTNDIQRLLS